METPLDEKFLVKSDRHVLELPRSCYGDSSGVVNNGATALLKTLIHGERAELPEIHGAVQLSHYLIQLSTAQKPSG